MDHTSDDLADEFNGDIDLPESVDRAAVERMRTVAHLLDDAVRVPGTGFRVGVDPVLGLLGGVGDLIAAAGSLYVVAEAARLGVSYGTLLRMLANVTLDVAVGTVPVVGDLLDAIWKANRRNVDLALEDLAGQPADHTLDEYASDPGDADEPLEEDVVDVTPDRSRGVEIPVADADDE
jgi:hypothetical protein